MSVFIIPSERRAVRTFRDLLAWPKAHEFVLRVYALIAGFPRQETYGLASQMRRAAVSIPANIAEGFRHRGQANKARFLGSLPDVSHYYLILAQDLQYGDTTALAGTLDDVRRSLGTYSRTVLSSTF